MSIEFLDNITASKIAAGEVITDPASAVKELVENSIDAGSRNIEITLEDGGKKLIKVTDDGCGIDEGDVVKAFSRHATSKIKAMDDLNSLSTLGFRGEALASIAAISRVTLRTASNEDGAGILVKLAEGKTVKKPIAYRRGTSISIEDLFYNTPARLKHMKKSSEENRKVTEITQVLALSNPDVSITLTIDGRMVMKTPGQGGFINTVYSIFGSEFGKSLFKADFENSPMGISGFLGDPFFSKKTRDYQYLYINRRYVKDIKISKAIEDAYDDMIMINNYPTFILNIDLPSDMLDVNIHPAKTKVKILNESLIILLLKNAVRKILRESIKGKRIEDSKISGISFPESAPEEKKDYFRVSEAEPTVQKEEPKADQVKLEPQRISEAVKQENPALHTSAMKTKAEIKCSEVSRLRNVSELRDEPKQNDGSLKKIDELLEHGKFIGQLFNTYLILEVEGDTMILVDQHAAHERILYEKITRDVRNHIKNSQNIIPVQKELTPVKFQFLKNNKEIFFELGFEFDEFGMNTIILRAVPIFLGKPAQVDLIDVILDTFKGHEVEELKTSIIMASCKGAVKGNQKLNSLEINQLLKELRNCHMPFTCPHGRPVIITMTRYEIEKLFKRVT
ncbi:MAG: DNA mismatch repair endonuclease MutL [Eubacteriaceae bacterium]|nr:DNA mismatch repair endonuclease MutL [Eubacteriaceae bacterium]